MAEYPRMMFHHGSRTRKIVKSEIEELALGKEWKRKPFLPEEFGPRETEAEAEPAAGQSDAGEEVIAARDHGSRLKNKKKAG